MKINKIFKITRLATFIVLTFTPVLSPADAFEAVSDSDKMVKIRPAGTSTETNALQVELQTEKNSYRVNEKIRFKIKSNKAVFVYMFNIDPATGKALLILPNKYQSKGKIKYPGDNQWRLLPNQSLEFYADRPGTERIVMVASEKYIDINKKLKNASNNKSAGNFFMMNSPLDDLDSAINEAYNPGASADKLIQMRSAKPTSPSLPSGVVTKEMSLRIR